MRLLGHTLIVGMLTILTQLGGLAWLGALGFRRRLLAFVLLYAVIWVGAVQLAPLGGRQALPCFGEPLQMQSPFYCVTLRHFVKPELADLAGDVAARVEAEFPGTLTLALDGGFPFFDGFPLLPHLSHSDGEKLDFAFYYTDAMGGVSAGQDALSVGVFCL